MTSTLLDSRTNLADWNDLNKTVLHNAAGLRVDLLENGTVGAFSHHDTLINQMLGIPPEGSPFRLWLRSGSDDGGASLINPSVIDRFIAVDQHRAVWHGHNQTFSWSVLLALEAGNAAWSWQIDVTNHDVMTRVADVVLAQDVGLAATAGLRLNENYNSHYIDYVILNHPDWGPVICARQNLAQTDAQHPWLAVGCPTGATAFATDGMDVFGLEQRTLGIPRILRGHDLPSVRRQGESACAALQSQQVTLEPGASTTFQFVMQFEQHHPLASDISDLQRLAAVPRQNIPDGGHPVPRSIFDEPALLHGDDFTMEQWNRWFPERRHEEHHERILWSFFTPDGRHVVSKAKENHVERMSGHILLGSSNWLYDNDALGATVYAPGIFSAQVYFGSPSFCRLLTVIRDPLQRLRSSGQRVWVHIDQAWRLLGSPSAFEMAGDHATWWYQLRHHLIVITWKVQADTAAGTLECRIHNGSPVRWRVTHQLALDANELDSSGMIEYPQDHSWIRLKPAPESQEGLRHPNRSYRLSFEPEGVWSRRGGDKAIWMDGQSRMTPHLVAETREADQITVRFSVDDSSQADRPANKAGLPEPAWRITEGSPEMIALADILPWFRHDAWIHLASPHGLEQYGGGAWGVRDVCQGPMEWLLTEQRYIEARKILHLVFSHQYHHSGMWPQWFMLGSYAEIEQKHCHGDVMFWPIKALCDYAEAANDPGILDVCIPFASDPQGGSSRGRAPLIDHVWLVVAAYRTMCVGDTSLIAYGEGDWDDTLQPATKDMRHGMVSAWTTQLAYHAFRQLSELLKRSGRVELAATLAKLCEEIHFDFMRYLMPDGVVAGFAMYRNYEFVPLLHPRDQESGIAYRLLPMTRGILSGMFDPAQAAAHMALVKTHLRFPDGVRLMNQPVPYRGGISRMFQRAETSAYFGREVSLNYVHAHLRYAEATASMGDADELWWALGAANPLALRDRVANASPRQANVYFSSSDGDFADRYEAELHYNELREGKRSVKAGWRLYSSGPGLFLHKVRNCLFGIREYYDQVIFDPVIPEHQLPCSIQIQHEGKSVAVHFEKSPTRSMTINGQPAPVEPTGQDHRGICLNRRTYQDMLCMEQNVIRFGIASS